MQTVGRCKANDSQLDSASFELADLFAHPHIALPFRLPTLHEQIRESELGDLLQKSPLFAQGLVGESLLLNFLGNYFKPSALVAAVSQDTGLNDLQAFLLTKNRLVPVVKPTPLSVIVRKYNNLADEVRKDPRFKTLKHPTQAPLPCPEDRKILLSEDFYSQLRLFSKTPAPNVSAPKRYQHAPFERTTLLAKQTPVFRPLPTVEGPLALALHSSPLAKLHTFPITFQARHFLPDPGGHIANIGESTGPKFIDDLVAATVASFSGSAAPDSALILFVPHLGIRRVLGKSFRVKSLNALICSSSSACFSLVASSSFAFECPVTNSIIRHISAFITAVDHLLVSEADIVAFKQRHACPQFLSDHFLLAFEASSALVHLPQLDDQKVFLLALDGNYRCDSTSADAACRVFLGSATAISNRPAAIGKQGRTFADNFIQAMSPLVLSANEGCVLCSFSFDCSTTNCVAADFEEVLLHTTCRGSPVSFKFHSFVCSSLVSIPDFLSALGNGGRQSFAVPCNVFIHIVCCYAPSTQCAPATFVVRSKLAGLCALPHLTSPLLVAGIGEAHPT
jgi:hypothetical protein